MPEFTGRLRTPRLAGAPSSPALGEMYYDTTTNKLYWWNSTSWIDSGGVTKAYVDARDIPVGGATGQVLAKIDNVDYNTQWIAPPSGGSSSAPVAIAASSGTGTPVNMTTGGSSFVLLPTGTPLTTATGTVEQFERQSDGTVLVKESGWYAATFSTSAPIISADTGMQHRICGGPGNTAPSTANTMAMADFSSPAPSASVTFIGYIAANTRIGLLVTSRDSVVRAIQMMSFGIARINGPKGDKGDTGGNATVAMDTWHSVGAAGEPAFLNSFINRVANGQGLQFRKDPLGRVMVRGQVMRTPAPGADMNVFVLPVGYRPPASYVRFPVISSDNISTQMAGYAYVDAAGNVSVTYTGTYTGTCVWDMEFSFDTDSVTAMPTGPKGDKGDTGGNATVPMDSVHYVGGSGEPAFQNSWINYDNSAATPGTGAQRSLTFRKDPLGKVSLAGTIKGGANGTAIFTLPVGYRPLRPAYWSAFAGGNVFAFVWVDVGGVVWATNTTGANVTSFVMLDEVEFDTETVTAMPTGPQGPKGDTGGNATVPIEAWHNVGAATEPAFLGTFGNHAGTLPCQFRKLPDGVVELRGFARGGTGNVFTLPAGYRPVGQDVMYFPTTVEPGGSPLITIVAATGVVAVSGSYTTAQWVNIGCRFTTDQATFPTGPTGPQGPQGKQTISRSADFGAQRDATVGGYGEVTTALRVAVNFTAGNYVRFHVTGQWEHTVSGMQYMVLNVFDVTGNAMLPNACCYWIMRTFNPSQNVTYTFETVIPVASSGATGYVLPGPRTLTLHAQTAVARCIMRNDTVPMVFTAQELQQ